MLDGTVHFKSGTWPDRILVTDSQRVKDPIKWRKSAVMTDRWRLINGRELYDIKNDPGQRTDLADQHLETAVAPDAREAVFTLPLKAGNTRLTARFITRDGKVLGAYYAIVKKL